ncbi:MAG: serine/threonine protein kinase [Burkholderiaceae bacterium]
MGKRFGPGSPDSAALHDFADLTPDAILDGLDALGVRGDGRLLALNSYENRVYLVYGEDGPDRVVKFYRRGRWRDEQIAEEHTFVAELAAAELPVVAPLSLHGRTLHDVAGCRLAVYPRAGGRAPDLDQPDVLEWLGRFMGRIHAIGAVRPFATRPRLDVDTYAVEPRQFLLEHDVIPNELRAAWVAVVDQCIDGIRASFDRAGDVRWLRVHGDCHMGNVLWTDDGPHFVDFDDARMAPAVQDLWMLLSGSRADMTGQMSDVLEGYEMFAEFDRRELHLVEAMRTLRLIHYSAWIARRWHDPAFPAAFPWFASSRYWEERILELREQLGAMSEPALVI